jgi:hypothetical protein
MPGTARTLLLLGDKLHNPSTQSKYTGKKDGKIRTIAEWYRYVVSLQGYAHKRCKSERGTCMVSGAVYRNEKHV